ncbi:hypothetical protein AB6A40_002243 [Gnathostoma spinigerum]|uniref:Vesicle transport protein n=1 Tax=Gnathostoma spinigerum TaxID=75299 RepID=A0ABD6EBL3_9BILA
MTTAVRESGVRVSVDDASESLSRQQSKNNEDPEITTSMPWDLRVQCFIGCIILSLVCSFMGSALILVRKLTGFSVMVSLGSIVSLLGTCFLMGPINQLKKMCEKSRYLASLIYILMIALTLVAGLILENPILAIVCVVGQYIAMAWYSISYIPFARNLVANIFSYCCG